MKIEYLPCQRWNKYLKALSPLSRCMYWPYRICEDVCINIVEALSYKLKQQVGKYIIT